MLKKHKVIMLPTNKASNLFLKKSVKTDKLELEWNLENPSYGINHLGWVYEHLYFLSDEGIKAGDWITDGIILTHAGSDNPPHKDGYKWKKVIASTDKDLVVEGKGGAGEVAWRYPLPQIRESFVKKFIEAYNTGKPIEYVNLEYEPHQYSAKLPTNFMDYVEPGMELPIIQGSEKVHSWKLKLRPDNTVIIDSVKDTFTREEVLNIVKRAMDYADIDSGQNCWLANEEDLIQWFNENY